MPKFRKKPVVIEAIQWTGFNIEEIDKFAKGFRRTRFADNMKDLQIETSEGNMMTANEGDWIIRGIKDEIYPCKENIFEATYEAL